MIPIKISYECRCPKCGDYMKGEELNILSDDGIVTIYCDYCDCELFCISSNYFKGEKK